MKRNLCRQCTINNNKQNNNKNNKCCNSFHWKMNIMFGGGKPQWTVLQHNGPLFPPIYKAHGTPVIINNKERIFFESSAIAKIRKIKSLNLDFFVDDLVTILNHRQFPDVTKKILFNSSALKLNNIYVASNWDEVKSFIVDEE